MDNPIEKIYNLLTNDGKLPGMLAGGCVRDFFNNKEIKDFDFFVSHVEGFRIHHHLWGMFGHIPYERRFDENMYLSSNQVVTCNRISVDGCSVDLIEVKPEVNRGFLKSFDLGINMCCFDPAGFYLTEEYHKDMMNSTITIYNPNPNKDFHNKRLERLSLKYPWKVVDKEGYLEWVNF